MAGAATTFGRRTGPTARNRNRLLSLATIAGLAVGTIMGLVSGDPRLVLVEGSVPTAVFGLVCLARCGRADR